MKTSAEYVSCAMLAVSALTTAVTLEPDDESDSAPFTVGVEHGDGRRCGAALVSLHTALTSARCASGDGDEGEMWARAAGPGPAPRATRVVRVALATGTAPSSRAWGASVAARDVALLELATSLGGARPILLASSRADCAGAEAACYLVRALSWGANGARLRIVELAQREARECWPPPSPAAVSSSALGEQALCLTGPDLCEMDRGAGVVCSGKLCGVLSGSRGEGQCGTPHAAVSVPRWRRFLHCAHTSGACGRDGECAQLCSERWLTEEPAPAGADGGGEGGGGEGGGDTESGVVGGRGVVLAAPSAPDDGLHSPERTTFVDISETAIIETTSSQVTVVTPTRSPPPPPPPPAPQAEGDSITARHSFEFEPNRADFTAGEYGDNAADYIAPDEATPPATTAPAPPPPPPPLRTAPRAAPAAAAVMAHHSPATPAKTSKVSAAAPSTSTLPALLLYLCSAIHVF